jgi:hypothetical protein
VARELAPAGARSGPALWLKSMGLLRSPAGASSLATDTSRQLEIQRVLDDHVNPVDIVARLGTVGPVGNV